MPKGIPKNGINKGWFLKNREVSDDEKKKMSERMTKNPVKYWLGKKHTQEYKDKMSESCSGKEGYWLGKKFTKKHRIKIGKNTRGENNTNWKGGVTAKNMLLRSRIESKLWREAVFERDDYTCQKCNKRSGNGKTIYINSHHIQNFAEYPELRFAIDNGITLCKECHLLFHKTFGFRYNNEEQLNNFLKQDV